MKKSIEYVRSKLILLKELFFSLLKKIAKRNEQYKAKKFSDAYYKAVKENGGVEMASMPYHKSITATVEKNKNIEKEKRNNTIVDVIKFVLKKIISILV